MENITTIAAGFEPAFGMSACAFGLVAVTGTVARKRGADAEPQGTSVCLARSR